MDLLLWVMYSPAHLYPCTGLCSHQPRQRGDQQFHPPKNSCIAIMLALYATRSPWQPHL